MHLGSIPLDQRLPQRIQFFNYSERGVTLNQWSVFKYNMNRLWDKHLLFCNFNTSSTLLLNFLQFRLKGFMDPHRTEAGKYFIHNNHLCSVKVQTHDDIHILNSFSLIFVHGRTKYNSHKGIKGTYSLRHHPVPWLFPSVWSLFALGNLARDALVLTKELWEVEGVCQLHLSFSKSHDPSSVPQVPGEMTKSSMAGSLWVPEVALDTNASCRNEESRGSVLWLHFDGEVKSNLWALVSSACGHWNHWGSHKHAPF